MRLSLDQLTNGTFEDTEYYLGTQLTMDGSSGKAFVGAGELLFNNGTPYFKRPIEVVGGEEYDCGVDIRRVSRGESTSRLYPVHHEWYADIPVFLGAVRLCLLNPDEAIFEISDGKTTRKIKTNLKYRWALPVNQCVNAMERSILAYADIDGGRFGQAYERKLRRLLNKLEPGAISEDAEVPRNYPLSYLQFTLEDLLEFDLIEKDAGWLYINSRSDSSAYIPFMSYMYRTEIVKYINSRDLSSELKKLGVDEKTFRERSQWLDSETQALWMCLCKASVSLLPEDVRNKRIKQIEGVEND